ncbi:MAG TPA: hypothetical protein VJ984_04815 [Xanthomonadales bacterium]|nr:hypothetical protein [Xanthomonadales bacterium]
MIRICLAILLIAATFSAFADGTIDGWVRVHGHQYPLHPVTIRVYDAESGIELEQFRTENNVDGTYQINGLPNGNYKVHYDAHSEIWRYLDEMAGNRYCDNAGCDIKETGAVITVNDDTRTLNINLLEGGMMGGEVTDDRRRPIAGATVEFFDEFGEPLCCERITDDQGKWARPVYFPAKYYVLARLAEPSVYKPQVYPRKPCSSCDVTEEGTAITYNYFASYLGVDARLSPVEPGFSGQVKDVPRAKYSGSWFNPDRDGEGFIFEVLDRPGPDGVGFEVVVFWFTYTPDGKQAWMVGTGVVEGRLAEVDFQITDGASFGQNFDANDVARKEWGSMRLEFFNCSSAHAQYAGQYGSGQIDLSRLSAIDGLDCDDPAGQSVDGNATLSGAWFNPARDGQGFIVEVVNESDVLAYWFTYDTDGSQMWMLGLGELDESGNTQISMQRSSGGNFGDRFDPESVQLSDWGEVSIEFGECDEASYSWSAPEPYDAGAYNLTRLTTLKNADC